MNDAREFILLIFKPMRNSAPWSGRPVWPVLGSSGFGDHPSFSRYRI